MVLATSGRAGARSAPGKPPGRTGAAVGASGNPILQARSYATLLSHASDGAFGFERALAERALADLSASDRQALEAVLRDHPSPSPAEVAQARVRLDTLAPPTPPALVASVIVLATLLLAATLGLLLAPIVRGAPLLALFGIAIQSVEGERASRLRCLLRAAVAWGPLVLFHFWQPWLVLQVLAPLTVASAAVVALAWPDRGLPDLIAQTRLVPC
jgi:hypothetical protein